MGCYKNKVSKYINYGLNFISPLKKSVQNIFFFSMTTIKETRREDIMFCVIFHKP